MLINSLLVLFPFPRFPLPSPSLPPFPVDPSNRPLVKSYAYFPCSSFSLTLERFLSYCDPTPYLKVPLEPCSLFFFSFFSQSSLILSCWLSLLLFFFIIFYLYVAPLGYSAIASSFFPPFTPFPYSVDFSQLGICFLRNPLTLVIFWSPCFPFLAFPPALMSLTLCDPLFSGFVWTLFGSSVGWLGCSLGCGSFDCLRSGVPFLMCCFGLRSNFVGIINFVLRVRPQFFGSADDDVAVTFTEFWPRAISPLFWVCVFVSGLVVFLFFVCFLVGG